MKNSMLIVFAMLVLFGCSNSNQNQTPAAAQPEQNQVVITNDMENAAAMIPSWIFEKTVVKMENGPAHSGEYVTKVDGKDIYSYAYRENFENINQKLPKRVILNGWVNSPDPAKGLSVIMDVNENNVSKIWKAFSLTKTVETPNEWHEFTAYFPIDKPIQANYQIKLYAYSGMKTAYFDDFKITFEY
jgi:hypothetical protein